MSGDFDGAVHWAKSVLRPYVTSSGINLGNNEPSEILFRSHLRILWAPDDHGGRFMYHPRALTILLNYAESSRGAFDLLSDICAAHVGRGDVLPEIVRPFALLRMSGKLEPPPKTRASKTFMRNVHLYGVADVCMRDFGLTLTRGETSEPRSACDAVVQALAELGYHISWRAVKELFVNKSSANLREATEHIRAATAHFEEFAPDIAKSWRRSIGRAEPVSDGANDDPELRTETDI